MVGKKKIFNKKSTLMWPINASTQARTKLIVTNNAFIQNVCTECSYNNKVNSFHWRTSWSITFRVKSSRRVWSSLVSSQFNKLTGFPEILAQLATMTHMSESNLEVLLHNLNTVFQNKSLVKLKSYKEKALNQEIVSALKGALTFNFPFYSDYDT